MYFELKDGDQIVHTHSTLVDEKNSLQIADIYAKIPAWQSGTRFLFLWGSLEAVNRITALQKLPIYARVGVVAVPTLLGGFLGELAFWQATGSWSQVTKLLNGAPVYKRKIDVPELDKAYFFLDDDNNYRPSLNHHAVYQQIKP